MSNGTCAGTNWILPELVAQGCGTEYEGELYRAYGETNSIDLLHAVNDVESDHRISG